MKGIKAALLLVFGACVFNLGAAPSAGPGFELKNRAAYPIWITLTNGQKDVPIHYGEIKGKTSSGMFAMEEKINKNQGSILAVWRQDPGQVIVSRNRSNKLKMAPAKNVQPHAVYQFKPGKTIYLTWDPSQNAARPAKGHMYQTKKNKTTDSGYALINNVTADDISKYTLAK